MKCDLVRWAKAHHAECGVGTDRRALLPTLSDLSPPYPPPHAGEGREAERAKSRDASAPNHRLRQATLPTLRFHMIGPSRSAADLWPRKRAERAQVSGFGADKTFPKV